MGMRTAAAVRPAFAFMAGPAFRALGNLVLGPCPKRRARIVQWLFSALVYVGSGLVVLSFLCARGVALAPFGLWCTVFGTGLLSIYGLLRSGVSERLADPSMTQWQMLMGVLAVDSGYLLSGPFRTLVLLPLLLIFAFGAFSLHWKRIAVLTLLALGSLWLANAVLDAKPAWRGDPPDIGALRDRNNLLMVLVLLPSLAAIAARLSMLRSRLQARTQALRLALAQVQRLAAFDELTGLPNRRSMMERLAGAQVVASQGGPGFCVMLIDLDDFKRVNDLLGHAHGDALLRDFAREAADEIGTQGMLARWGGEEFLLLLGDASGLEPRQVCRRIQARASRLQGATGPLHLSAGIARHLIGESIIDTVARADNAMYEAKRNGGNALRIADTQPAVAG